MFFKIKDSFLLVGLLYLFVCLLFILFLAYQWLPTGTALIGHDSGLPIDAETFLKTRLFAWDGRIGFGIDNSANFGSITMHFFDWFVANVARVTYSGNYIAVFFWLGLIFTSAFFFAYQLNQLFGKTFVFILPPLVTFNFYIFQSVFMLERAKYGVFAATLFSLGIFLRMESGKVGAVSAAIFTALLFSIFNGGGMFGITYFGGAIFVLGAFILLESFVHIFSKNIKELKKNVVFLVLTVIFFLLFNAYSLVPFAKHFLADNPTAILQESLLKNNQAWLESVSRSSSFLNLFRFLGVPDWYGDQSSFAETNSLHPYSAIYLNNYTLIAISFIFPLVTFLALLIPKRGAQKRIIFSFAFIALIGAFLAAGSHKPFGFIYKYLMEVVPGFVLFRSAFYKFGIFYLFAMLVLFSFTLGRLIEAVASIIPNKMKNIFMVFCLVITVSSWLGYHWVLFDSSKIFAWQNGKTTKTQIPDYVFEFSRWSKDTDFEGKRVLLLPPLNKDWQSDAYDWGYWSLSPLYFALSDINALSNWHGLGQAEVELVSRLSDAVKVSDKQEFVRMAERLNVGYLLLRKDALMDSVWASSENPKKYKDSIDQLGGVTLVKTFGEWVVYKLTDVSKEGVYSTSNINIVPDRYVAFANEFFETGNNVNVTASLVYPQIADFKSKELNVYDCLSCLVEGSLGNESLPSVSVLPGSKIYFLKDYQERKLLSQVKKPEAKIVDYLGVISKRAAEQKRLIEIFSEPKYQLQNAKVIRKYLDETYNLLLQSAESANNFETATKIFEILNPVERMFKDYSSSTFYKLSSQQLADEILGAMWSVNRIFNFFSPVLENSEHWSNTKVYGINLHAKGEKFTLLYPTNKLPNDLKGDVMLPRKLVMTKNDIDKPIDLRLVNGWLQSQIIEESGEALVTAYFEELPNLLNVNWSGMERFSWGKAACLRGEIRNFDKTRTYEVSAKKFSKLQTLKIIVNDSSSLVSKKHGFLQDRNNIEVLPYAQYGLTRHIFRPTSSVGEISVYVCSNNDEMPDLNVDKVEIREFFSPSLITTRDESRAIQENIITSYSQKDAVNYSVEVKGATDQYVLVLNQKFSPSWSLQAVNADKSTKKIGNHFTVDGYANGWLISDYGAKEFKIEYTPQVFFRPAVVVSVGAVFISILWLVISNIKNKQKK